VTSCRRSRLERAWTRRWRWPYMEQFPSTSRCMQCLRAAQRTNSRAVHSTNVTARNIFFNQHNAFFSMILHSFHRPIQVRMVHNFLALFLYCCLLRLAIFMCVSCNEYIIFSFNSLLSFHCCLLPEYRLLQAIGDHTRGISVEYSSASCACTHCACFNRLLSISCLDPDAVLLAVLSLPRIELPTQ